MADSKDPTPDHARKGEVPTPTREVCSKALGMANYATMEVMDKLSFLQRVIGSYSDGVAMSEDDLRGLSYILGDCNSRLKTVLEIF